jgi:hypothetical protein
VGRKGKTDGQPAHTREVKLGCVFTQTTWDEEGYALRDRDSTTYTGAIETAQEFGKRIYREAWNRGWSRAGKKVVMGDGAEWIWNLADARSEWNTDCIGRGESWDSPTNEKAYPPHRLVRGGGRTDSR